VYDADKLSNSNVLLSDQQHHQVLEVDTFGNVVWQFRNDRLPYEVSRSLLNGSFARRDARGMPAHWMAYVKTSEGGGLVVWDEAGGPAPCPGVQFDRAGAFSLYPVVGVKAGAVCRLDGEIRAEIESGAAVAFFQLAFLDAFGGLIEDVVKAPKGELLTSTAGWRKDSIEAKAPGRATAVEVHLRISGRGAAWMRNVSLATR
jgi:hypothetical protein